MDCPPALKLMRPLAQQDCMLMSSHLSCADQEGPAQNWRQPDTGGVSLQESGPAKRSAAQLGSLGPHGGFPSPNVFAMALAAEATQKRPFTERREG